ncbi:hypothetical protein LDENG_00148520 [Lucifuga dentata]|nr:hypothetical protein LDENG_00148520 [Lucifuga dentata]
MTEGAGHLYRSWRLRPDLGVTFAKLHCWTLTHYSKCVFLEADTLVLCNVDELFDREELSAAPDPSWPDCFNSGVFVFRPSLETHARLLEYAVQYGSFDGGDQGLLNRFFSSWPVDDISKHLPFTYNLSTSSVYTYLPAFQQFGHNAKIVHFKGAVKPWSSGFSTQQESTHSHTVERFVSQWWKEYLSHTHTPQPVKEPAQDSDNMQQSHERDMDTAVRENADTRDSPTKHFSPSEEHHSSPEPKETHADKEEQLQELLDEESGNLKRKEIQDPPEESEGNDAASDTEIDPAEMEAEQLERRKLWEAGKADYLGRDAFRFIQKKLDCFLE